MIRINLLSASADVPRAAAEGVVEGAVESGFDEKQVQRQALVNLVIILFAPLCLYLYEQQTVPALRGEVAQLNQQLAEIASYNSKNEAAVNEIKKFESDRDRIQKQISFLERISQQRQKEIMILDLIQQVIPEKTWLRKVSIMLPQNIGPTDQGSPNKVLSVNGYSLADAEVLDFTEKLQRSTLLEGVVPKKTADTQLNTTTVKEFVIEGKLVN